jgi:AcrR family transcriptional regulator
MNREDAARTTRLPLSSARITTAAVALIDEHGLEALSMRRLAADLDVEAMALYKHLPNKAALLDAVTTAVLMEMRLPEGGGWEARCRSIAQEFRRVGLAHPHLFPLVATRRLDSGPGLRPIESMLAALRQGGFTGESAIRAMWFVIAFVTGSVLAQTGMEVVVTEDQGPPSPPEASEPRQMGELPNIVELAPILFSCDFDEEFEFGLDAQLRSLRRLRRAPA